MLKTLNEQILFSYSGYWYTFTNDKNTKKNCKYVQTNIKCLKGKKIIIPIINTALTILQYVYDYNRHSTETNNFTLSQATKVAQYLLNFSFLFIWCRTHCEGIYPVYFIIIIIMILLLFNKKTKKRDWTIRPGHVISFIFTSYTIYYIWKRLHKREGILMVNVLCNNEMRWGYNIQGNILSGIKAYYYLSQFCCPWRQEV